jgi:Domain of unknown function (DUF4062)/TIR domain
MSTALTVFVCSTFADLIDERTAVLEAIRRLQLQHDSMEYFGARPNTAIETCIDEVRRSDVLLVIVGHRYGTIEPSRGMSYSQVEYDDGYRLGKPCLVYFRDENTPVLPKHVERDSRSLQLLENWKAILAARHTVATFRDSNDLALSVTADIGRTMDSLKSSQAEARVSSAKENFWTAANAILQAARTAGVSDENILSALRHLPFNFVLGSQTNVSILLSYADTDRNAAAAFREALASAAAQSGLAISFIETDGSVDDPVYQMAVKLDTNAVDFVIVLLSKRSLASEWATDELSFAARVHMDGQGFPMVLPVTLEEIDISMVPPLLRDIKWLAIRDKPMHGYAHELVQAIWHWLVQRRDERLPQLRL